MKSMTISTMIQYLGEAMKEYERIAEDEGQMCDIDSYEYHMKEIELLYYLVDKLKTLRGGASVLSLGTSVTSLDSEGVGVDNLKRAYTALEVRRACLKCKIMEIEKEIEEIDSINRDLLVKDLLVQDQSEEEKKQ